MGYLLKRVVIQADRLEGIKINLKKYGVEVWIRYIWLRTEIINGFMLIR
jgi:hypothetical protein